MPPISNFIFRFLVACLFWAAFDHAASAQEFFRFKAEFSIKEKEKGAEQGRLIMGTVFFDKNLRKIAYDIRFPEPEQWLIHDTTLFRVAHDSLLSQQSVGQVSEYSLFNMILSQQLADFGLARAGYAPGEVRQEGTQTLSTWLPPEQLREYLGPVVLAQEQKRLTAIAFMAKDGATAAKFYLQDYQTHDGLPVPSKVYQIFYREQGEFVRILTFKNVTVNSTDEDNRYDFPLPAGR
jgi:hypothetical protein